MGANTKIGWTKFSASPWHGCAHKIEETGRSHPGCDHCYAEAFSPRNPGTLGVWGDDGTRVKSKSFADKCYEWNANAKRANRIDSVFPSICDPFEDRPELVPWRQEMFEVIDKCQSLRFLLLTKRPENIRRMWSENTRPIGPNEYREAMAGQADVRLMRRQNVCLGTSISDQVSANLQVPHMAKVKDLAAFVFLSCEPLLGEIDLTLDGLWCKPCPHCEDGIADPETGVVECRQCEATQLADVSFIDGIIVGGESGPNARPCDPKWVYSLREQTTIFGVDFFFKQWGEWLPYQESGSAPLWESERGDMIDGHQLPDGLADHQPIGEWYAPELDGIVYRKVGKVSAGNLFDGSTYEGLPWDQM